MKNIIKIVIKTGIVYKNDQFTKEEILLADKFRQKFVSLCMSVISFYEVDFSYDRNYLLTALTECSAMLKQLVGNHLTENSISRIEMVFTFFNEQFLDSVFHRSSQHRDILGLIVVDMHKAMENGDI